LRSVTDGAPSLILAAGDLARALVRAAAWITGSEHRIDLGGRAPGESTLRRPPSAAGAGLAAEAGPGGLSRVAPPFTHQELYLAAGLSARR